MRARTRLRADGVAWARRRGIGVDHNGYVLSEDDNFFLPPGPATRADFATAAGDELGRSSSSKGKALALHSSSALAINVFEHWRHRPEGSSVVARALGFGGEGRNLRFEAKHHTGWGSFPAHLDVALEVEELAVGVECKFGEPYEKSGRSSGYTLPVSYGNASTDTRRSRWRDIPRWKQLADDIISGVAVFRRLDAPQLIKHTLGMKGSYGVDGFVLVLLWYQVGHPDVGWVTETTEMRGELEAFTARVAADPVRFVSLSYRELVGRLADEVAADDEPYLGYLRERYRL